MLIKIPKIIQYILILLLLSNIQILAQDQDQDWTLLYDDPVELAQEYIKRSSTFWTPIGKTTTLGVYTVGKAVALNGGGYLLLESPSLCIDMVKGGFYEVANSVGKDVILDIVESSVKSPKKVCKSIGNQVIKEGIKDYKIAYNISRKYIETKELTREEAIEFLDRRWGFNKLAYARLLLNGQFDYDINEEVKKRATSELLDKFNSSYESSIGIDNTLPIMDAAFLIKDIENILRLKRAGLMAYQPYLDFKERMEYLNKMRMQEKKRWSESIKIFTPNKSTTWINGNKMMEIKWEATYPDDKPMQIILWKGDYKKAFKHISKNSGNFKIISLPDDTEPGDDYSISIQPLFVDASANEKNYIAYSEQFSIIKNNEDPSFRVRGNNIVPVRKSFAGRSVSYIKELHTKNKYIKVTVYDHGRVDGDIISLYLNGKSVVANYELNKIGRTFEVELEEGIRNDLFLYAHNLGEIAPNTVAIRIYDGYKQQEFVLNSDLRSCEAVVIYLNK